MKNETQTPYLYVFVDEGGNFDFSATGTNYFTVTTVTQTRPFLLDGVLPELKYDLIEYGLNIEYFHAAEDRQPVRDRVFSAITRDLDELAIDSLVVEKCKTKPTLQIEERFYPEMIRRLLLNVLQQTDLERYQEVIVITDTIPINKKRKAIEKAIKQTLQMTLPSEGTKYRILHQASKACISLQVADYCNWSIFRKWERRDTRSYETIESAIRSERAVFGPSDSTHY